MDKKLKIFIITQILAIIIACVIALIVFIPGGMWKTSEQLQKTIDIAESSEKAIALVSRGIPQEVVYNFIENGDNLSLEDEIFPVADGLELDIAITCETEGYQHQVENKKFKFSNLDMVGLPEYISSAEPFQFDGCVYVETNFENLTDRNVHETILLDAISVTGKYSVPAGSGASGVFRSKSVELEIEMKREEIKLFVVSEEEMALLKEVREPVARAESTNSVVNGLCIGSLIILIIPILIYQGPNIRKWISNYR